MSMDEAGVRSLAARGLAELARSVKPQPDPYGRALERYRRSQRRRHVVVSTGLVAVVLAGTALATTGGGGGAPALDGSENPAWANAKKWAWRLADTPVRGSLAKDTTFIAEFKAQVMTHMKAGRYSRTWPITDVRVLYAADIGPYRVAFVAYVLDGPDPKTQWPHASAWFKGVAGAGAGQLAEPSRYNGGGDGLEATAEGYFDDTGLVPGKVGDGTPWPSYQVELAPAGCYYESAPIPALSPWTKEATGSFIVRTPETQRPEYWRITCDGIARRERPAPGGFVDLTPAQRTAAVANARGTFNRQDAELNLGTVAEGNATYGQPTMLWGGKISGTTAGAQGRSFDGDAFLAFIPRVGGGWKGALDIRYEATAAANGTIGTGATFNLTTDPSDPALLVAVPLGEETDNLFVVPPKGTVRVRAVDARGGIVAEAAVAGDAALLKVTDREAVVVQGLDASGKVLGTGRSLGFGHSEHGFDRFH